MKWLTRMAGRRAVRSMGDATRKFQLKAGEIRVTGIRTHKVN